MRFIAVTSVLLLMGCSVEKQASKELSQLKAKYFMEGFIPKFRKLETPCLVEHQPSSEYQLIPFDAASMDTLILGGSGFGLKFYGVVTDSDIFTMIMYAPAATMIPVVMTFDKKGNRISGTSIDFGCWDGGPYDYTCTGSFVINKDMTISLNHETVVTKAYNSDSTGMFPVKYPLAWKGVIKKDGKVEIENRPD